MVVTCSKDEHLEHLCFYGFSPHPWRAVLLCIRVILLTILLSHYEGCIGG